MALPPTADAVDAAHSAEAPPRSIAAAQALHSFLPLATAAVALMCVSVWLGCIPVRTATAIVIAIGAAATLRHPKTILTLQWALLAAAVALVALAIVQPPIRGTHRFVTIGGRTLSLATPLLVLATMAAATVRSTRQRTLMLGAAIGLLLLQKSYSGALMLCAASSALLIPAASRRAVWMCAALTLSVVGALAANDNRRARITDFLLDRNEAYQGRQLAATWQSATLIGRNDSATLPHLPCSSSDLVLAHTARSNGALVATATITLQAAIFLGLMNRAIRCTGTGSDVARGAAVVHASLSIGHVLVNLGVLPPCGVPYPFVSLGGSAAAAAAINVAAPFLLPAEARPPEAVSTLGILCKWAGGSAYALLAVIVLARGVSH